EHPLNERFLFPDPAQWRRELAVLFREDVLPRVEELLVSRRDRAEFGPVATAAGQKLIGEEQPGLTLTQAGQLRFFPLIAIPHQLLECFVHWVRREVIGILALDDDERETVHEQYDVRDDEIPARTRSVDAELVDGEEVIALRVLEVDQFDIGELF